MAILFAGGEFEAFEALGDIAGTTGEFEFDTGVTAAFDGDYARGSMKMRRSSGVRAEFTPTLEGWLHFKLFHTAFNSGNLDSPLFRLIDTSTKAGGRAGMIFGAGSGNLDFSYWPGGSVYTLIQELTTGPGNDLENDTLYTFDIHWKIDDSTGIYELFLDGVSQGSFSGDTNVSDVATIDAFDMSAGMKTTATEEAHYSEVIISTESTIDMRLATLGATANGTNNDFTNGEPEIDDIGEPTDLTLIRSGSANDIQEFVVEDISAGASADGNEIAAVVVTARAMAGSSVVQNIQGSVRTNALPFVTGNLTVNSECLKPVVGVFDVNPDTTDDWTEAEVNALEIGIKSIA